MELSWQAKLTAVEISVIIAFRYKVLTHISRVRKVKCDHKNLCVHDLIPPVQVHEAEDVAHVNVRQKKERKELLYHKSILSTFLIVLNIQTCAP